MGRRAQVAPRRNLTHGLTGDSTRAINHPSPRIPHDNVLLDTGTVRARGLIR
jgi:hypothetical protein